MWRRTHDLPRQHCCGCSGSECDAQSHSERARVTPRRSTYRHRACSFLLNLCCLAYLCAWLCTALSWFSAVSPQLAQDLGDASPGSTPLLGSHIRMTLLGGNRPGQPRCCDATRIAYLQPRLGPCCCSCCMARRRSPAGGTQQAPLADTLACAGARDARGDVASVASCRAAAAATAAVGAAAASPSGCLCRGHSSSRKHSS